MPKPNGLFHTPESWNELIKWIELHAAADRPHLVTAAGMAWNLACRAAEQESSK